MFSRQRGQSPELHSKLPTARGFLPTISKSSAPLLIYYLLQILCSHFLIFFYRLKSLFQAWDLSLCLVEERSTMVGLIGGTMASASSTTSSICCSGCSWLWASGMYSGRHACAIFRRDLIYLLDSVASVGVSVVHMIVEASSVRVSVVHMVVEASSVRVSVVHMVVEASSVCVSVKHMVLEASVASSCAILASRFLIFLLKSTFSPSTLLDIQLCLTYGVVCLE